MKINLEHPFDVIEYHRKAARAVYSGISLMLACLVLFVLMAVAPDIAKNFESYSQKVIDTYYKEVQTYEKKFGESFRYIDEFDFSKISNPSPKEIERIRISRKKDKYINVYIFIVSVAQLEFDKENLQFLIKSVPLIFGGVMVGIFVTYRYHIQMSQEVYKIFIEKYDLDSIDFERSSSKKNENETN